MQDELNTKVVALSIRAGSQTARVTANVLKAAIRKYMAAMEQAKAGSVSETYHGKQTVSQLMRQNTGLTNIEVTDQNIKSFERVAKKYNIDFALKKDKSVNPPRYLVFFKAQDVDVMTAAFKEYTAKEVVKSKKPSIRKMLSKSLEKAKQHQREKVKTKDRGQEL
jgi:hypothetical protein